MQEDTEIMKEFKAQFKVYLEIIRRHMVKSSTTSGYLIQSALNVTGFLGTNINIPLDHRSFSYNLLTLLSTQITKLHAIRMFVFRSC